jgi:hypothetical protein
MKYYSCPQTKSVTTKTNNNEYYADTTGCNRFTIGLGGWNYGKNITNFGTTGVTYYAVNGSTVVKCTTASDLGTSTSSKYEVSHTYSSGTLSSCKLQNKN